MADVSRANFTSKSSLSCRSNNAATVSHVTPSRVVTCTASRTHASMTCPPVIRGRPLAAPSDMRRPSKQAMRPSAPSVSSASTASSSPGDSVGADFESAAETSPQNGRTRRLASASNTTRRSLESTRSSKCQSVIPARRQRSAASRLSNCTVPVRMGMAADAFGGRVCARCSSSSVLKMEASQSTRGRRPETDADSSRQRCRKRTASAACVCEGGTARWMARASVATKPPTFPLGRTRTAVARSTATSTAPSASIAHIRSTYSTGENTSNPGVTPALADDTPRCGAGVPSTAAACPDTHVLATWIR
eukprot:Opistho-2@85968